MIPIDYSTWPLIEQDPEKFRERVGQSGATRPGAAAGLRWSVLLDPPLDGARNMARDHALAAGLGADEAVLRIYRWDPPTISLGRNEPARGRYDLALAARGGFAFVRRPSGGRAVLHDRELTYAVVLPVRALGGPRRAYADVNAGLARALRTLGVPAELAGSGERTAALTAGPCFQRPADGEVTVHGRKLVGSAQVRIGGVLLQHGSLLLGPGQERLGTLRVERAARGPEPVSLAEVLQRAPVWDDLVHAVSAGLQAELGGDWGDGEPRRPVVDPGREEALVRRYASDAWTWRR
jgi:lipoate-protein ligase A